MLCGDSAVCRNSKTAFCLAAPRKTLHCRRCKICLNMLKWVCLPLVRWIRIRIVDAMRSLCIPHACFTLTRLSNSPLSFFLAVSRALLSPPLVCFHSLSLSLFLNGCSRVDLTMLRQQRRHRRRQH